MEDQREGEMNLDLNLGPVSPVSGGSALGNGIRSSLGETVNLDDWVVGHSLHRRFREALRQRNRQRWRWRDWDRGHLPLESHDVSMNLMVDPGAAAAAAAAPVAVVGHDIHGTMLTGEGSNAAEGRNDEITKLCENVVAQSEDDAADKQEDVEKGIGTDGSSFFDCNICLDLAKEPIVTSCGHLFCWPCLYRWLHIHSDAKECPVCKGEVTVKNVTPIFGRGNGARDSDEDPGVKIPDRPPARRVESLRQAIQRTALSIPMEEMIRRLGSRFDLTRDFFEPQEGDGPRNMLDRSSTLLGRILTSRGLRREQNVVPTDDVDLTLHNENRPEVAEYHRRLPHLFYRRSQSYRGAPTTVAASGTTSAERFVETVIRTPPHGRSQERPPSVDDRDSFSSIVAVIHGESQTLDTAVEIDSTVSLSTSSSRRRNDASRISDVDSGDSRMPRRRRIN